MRISYWSSYVCSADLLDKLLKLRSKLNAGLTCRGVNLSVNDLLIKALAVSLMQVPECNVQFAGDQMLKFSRVDISVAVSIPGGLITPIIKDAASKGVAAISSEMKDLGHRAKDRSEEHTSELQSLMRNSYAVFCLKKTKSITRK